MVRVKKNSAPIRRAVFSFEDYRFLRRVVFRFLAAGFRFATFFFAGFRLEADLRRVVFFFAGFRFLAAGFRFAAFFFFAAGFRFLAAGFRRVVFFFAAGFRFAVVFRRVAFFFFAGIFL